MQSTSDGSVGRTLRARVFGAGWVWSVWLAAAGCSSVPDATSTGPSAGNAAPAATPSALQPNAGEVASNPPASTSDPAPAAAAPATPSAAAATNEGIVLPAPLPPAPQGETTPGATAPETPPSTLGEPPSGEANPGTAPPVGPPRAVRIFLVGDSTMQDYSIREDYLTNYYPQAGWGEMLQGVLSADQLPSIANLMPASSVEVINWARGGRSTRSFVQEGRWQQVLELLQAGDYVFIQFGHNDEASCTDYPERCTSIPEFAQYLRDYVDTARAKGATPLLITPINRDYPWANGALSNVHGEYPATMQAVGKEKDVPVIDGTRRSLDLFNSQGEAFTTRRYFLVFDAGAYPNYRVTPEFPSGSPSNDRTHLTLEGASAIAQTVLEGLRDLVDIRVAVEPASCGSVSGAGWFEKKYAPSATLTATANAGCSFAGWSGDASGSGLTTSVPVDRNRSITARFVPAQ